MNNILDLVPLLLKILRLLLHCISVFKDMAENSNFGFFIFFMLFFFPSVEVFIPGIKKIV